MSDNQPYEFKGMPGFALRDLKIIVNSDSIENYPRYWREFAKQLHADIFDLEFKKDQEIYALREVEKAARANIGLMCVNGNHANQGCKACAVSVALKKLDECGK